MLETVSTVALLGLTAHPVQVEVSIRRGTPMIQVVGLAVNAARESRERLRSAASLLGLHVPGLRITVNLAPADLRKEGPAFDLPILVGILAAAGRLPPGCVRGVAMVGELGLDGGLRPVRGALPIALRCRQESSVRALVVPRGNLPEAGSVSGLDVYGAGDVGALLDHLVGGPRLPGASPDRIRLPSGSGTAVDLSDVRGQDAAKRAMEVAAAGGHNLLLRGAPGGGKTMLARRLPTLLPPLSTEEALDATAIHSAAGRIAPGTGLLSERPFRAPHHSVSMAGLIGGGSIPRPGEVSLAHHGVLFLDEIPEFPPRALDALRQPMEEGHVTVVRSRMSVRFPAGFQLVAAMNPCPCGYHGNPSDACTCALTTLRRYAARVSGPLRDRMDLLVDVPAVEWRDLTDGREGEDSDSVRARVVAARALAYRRGQHRANARLVPAELRRHCPVHDAGEELLRRAMDRFQLSARGYWRVLRVARTIADLAGRPGVAANDLAEALGYRFPDVSSMGPSNCPDDGSRAVDPASGTAG